VFAVSYTIEHCQNILSEHLLFQMMQADNEIQSLRRRNQVLEDESDRLETLLRASQEKLHEASKVVDEFERYVLN